MRSGAGRLALCLAAEAVGGDFVRAQMAEAMAQAAAAHATVAQGKTPQPTTTAQHPDAINHAASDDEPQSFADFVTQRAPRRPTSPKEPVAEIVEFAPIGSASQKNNRRGCASFCDESTCFQDVDYPECSACGPEDGCHEPPNPAPPEQPPPAPKPTSPSVSFSPLPPMLLHSQHRVRHSPPPPERRVAITRHERFEHPRLKAPLSRRDVPLLPPDDDDDDDDDGIEAWQVIRPS